MFESIFLVSAKCVSRIKLTGVALLATVTLLTSPQVLAAPIVGPGQISFSGATAGTIVTSGSYARTIDGILDAPGNNSPFNGVSLETFPLTVTYNFNVGYDLTTFFLQGEVGTNSLSNAVNGFELRFYDGTDGGGSQVGSVFQDAQTSPTALQSFDLTAGNFLNVRSFGFSVISVNGTGSPTFVPGRVEYSEIQFAGSASPVTPPPPPPTPVDEPSSLVILSLGLLGLCIARRRRATA
jgi:hypothetical protein